MRITINFSLLFDTLSTKRKEMMINDDQSHIVNDDNWSPAFVFGNYPGVFTFWVLSSFSSS